MGVNESNCLLAILWHTSYGRHDWALSPRGNIDITDGYRDS